MYYFIADFPWWLTSFCPFVPSPRRLEVSIKPSLWVLLMSETGFLNKFIHSPRNYQLLVHGNEHMRVLRYRRADFASVLCRMLFLLSSDEETAGNIFLLMFLSWCVWIRPPGAAPLCCSSRAFLCGRPIKVSKALAGSGGFPAPLFWKYCTVLSLFL